MFGLLFINSLRIFNTCLFFSCQAGPNNPSTSEWFKLLLFPQIEIESKISSLDNEINLLEKETMIDPKQTKEIDEKIKSNSDKKIENHEEK